MAAIHKIANKDSGVTNADNPERDAHQDRRKGRQTRTRGLMSSLRREPDVPADLLRALFGNVTEPYKFECNADFLTELYGSDVTAN
jgi:hypothetical protein